MASWKLTMHQWEFQEPKMKVPTIYKAYISGLCKGIPPQNMALYGTVPPSILGSWNSHWLQCSSRIFPAINCKTYFRRFSSAISSSPRLKIPILFPRYFHQSPWKIRISWWLTPFFPCFPSKVTLLKNAVGPKIPGLVNIQKTTENHHLYVR